MNNLVVCRKWNNDELNDPVVDIVALCLNEDNTLDKIFYVVDGQGYEVNIKE